ncbi:MAG: 30S ribosomal protein S9 [Anaerolineae bacterium]|nr:30S ribosomal protein S9 [Anaerolineae bacterium]MDW8101563.1 30S ribosomal protein S9 [Anaerolineae bacterium]
MEQQLRYYYARGRRKEASAQVRLYPGGTGKIIVNEKPLEEYFPLERNILNVLSPLKITGLEGKFDITVKVEGGGVSGQADAIKLGIARALILYNPQLKPALKQYGLLTRDPREKERKKVGLKRARKAPRYSKR